MLDGQIERLQQFFVHNRMLVIALGMALVKVGLNFGWLPNTRITTIDPAVLLPVVQIVAVPLCVINPQAWFAIFMTSLAFSSFLSGMKWLAIGAVFAMFATLYAREFLFLNRDKPNSNRTSEAKLLQRDLV